MPMECRPIGVLLHVPEPNGVVEAGACQGPSVRTPGHRLDPIGLSGQRLEDASTGNIPELDRLVPAGTGKQAPVGGKGQSHPPVGVPLQDRDARGRPALLSLPEPDLPIEAESGEQVPIGTPGDGKDRMRMRERLKQCARLRIPKPDRRIGSSTGQHGAIGGIGDPRDIGGMRA